MRKVIKHSMNEYINMSLEEYIKLDEKEQDAVMSVKKKLLLQVKRNVNYFEVLEQLTNHSKKKQKHKEMKDAHIELMFDILQDIEENTSGIL